MSIIQTNPAHSTAPTVMTSDEPGEEDLVVSPTLPGGEQELLVHGRRPGPPPPVPGVVVGVEVGAPSTSQYGCAMVRVVAHHVEAATSEDPLGDCGDLAVRKATVEVARGHEMHLEEALALAHLTSSYDIGALIFFPSSRPRCFFRARLNWRIFSFSTSCMKRISPVDPE